MRGMLVRYTQRFEDVFERLDYRYSAPHTRLGVSAASFTAPAAVTVLNTMPRSAPCIGAGATVPRRTVPRAVALLVRRVRCVPYRARRRAQSVSGQRRGYAACCRQGDWVAAPARRAGPHAPSVTLRVRSCHRLARKGSRTRDSPRYTNDLVPLVVPGPSADIARGSRSRTRTRGCRRMRGGRAGQGLVAGDGWMSQWSARSLLFSNARVACQNDKLQLRAISSRSHT